MENLEIHQISNDSPSDLLAMAFISTWGTAPKTQYDKQFLLPIAPLFSAIFHLFSLCYPHYPQVSVNTYFSNRQPEPFP